MPPQPYRRPIAGGLLLLAALVLVQTASAGRIAIRRVDTRQYPTIALTVVAPSSSRRTPVLAENGHAVTGVQAENLGRKQSIVLAIDHSQSMHGRPLADAIDAAQTFVASKPTPDRIAIVAFASQALDLSDFSSSSGDAEDVLPGISTDRTYGTALWDAVALASHKLRNHGLAGRVVVLVTDGQETTSKSTLAQAIKAARLARAAVYAIAIPSAAFSPGPLRQLARETGGRYIEAPSSKALKGIYREIAAELAHTWQLQYLTAARPGDRLRLAVSSGGARAVVVERVPGRPGRASAGGTPVVLILALLVGFGLVAFLVVGPLASRLNLPQRRRGSDEF